MREKSSSPNSRMPPRGRSRASRRSSTCRHLPWANKPVVASTSPLRSRLVTAPENSMGEPSPSRMSSPRHMIQMYSPLRLRTWYSRSCSSVLPQSMSSMDSSKLWRSRSAMSSRHRGMSPSNTRPGRSKSCCMFFGHEGHVRFHVDDVEVVVRAVGDGIVEQAWVEVVGVQRFIRIHAGLPRVLLPGIQINVDRIVRSIGLLGEQKAQGRGFRRLRLAGAPASGFQLGPAVAVA